MRGARSGKAKRPLLARTNWSIIAEAGLALAAASAITRLLPFRRYIAMAALPLPIQLRSDARVAARIVDAVGDRLPFRTVCLQRGLALQWMLRRRGFDAVLHYGVELQKAGGELAAHVWVSVDDAVLIGAPQHERYAEVARFPS